jgi:hypothetical protein
MAVTAISLATGCLTGGVFITPLSIPDGVSVSIMLLFPGGAFVTWELASGGRRR